MKNNTKALKNMAAKALRKATRGYIRYAPWRVAKRAAWNTYSRHVDWRPHRETVRTRFGALMNLSTPEAVDTTIYLTGEWEPLITRYIRANLKVGDTFVDVGANIGYYSLLAASIVGTSGKVFAIEAEPTIYERLRLNVNLNNYSNVVVNIHAAATRQPGEISIFLNDSGNAGHSTTVQSLAAQEGMLRETKVRGDRLDSLAGFENLKNARFIKLDVEGAELDVLSPLFDSLGQFTDTEWLVELSPGYAAGGQSDVDQIYWAFRNAGYVAYQLPNDYAVEFKLDPPTASLKVIESPPTAAQTDVLMSRRPLQGTVLN